MRRWLAGKKSANPPEWIPLLLMAEEFGVPPWQIEKEINSKWYVRWHEYRIAKNMEQERQNKLGEKKHGIGTKRSN